MRTRSKTDPSVHPLGAGEKPNQGKSDCYSWSGERPQERTGQHGPGPWAGNAQGKNRKKNKKAKRVTTSTFAPHAGSARMDSLSQVASAAGVRGDELSHRGPNLATDEGKAAGSTSQGQNDNSEGDRPAASGSKSRPAHYGPKQEYRADAGGSLRMQKKRRNRPHAIDTQSADSHGNSAGAVKDAAPNPGLNPLALTFVSPSHAAPENKGANAGKGGGYRGGSTKGGSDGP
ncbi:uncharacterized protein HRG_11420 [Hirsutella rhossiliensis]|uniref:Uncharacterized protein n=1 Tax=Hirsutella rhossiliensis TaxID=111463 RepID=A0A9P8SC54_9HYPO|nr:uncharacterized protein HRG_11420 [Hirsutella rhossiliensis]KAH0957273.1 hypothetical protein HRG_11420 [Hirsutella rhossiliensis]